MYTASRVFFCLLLLVGAASAQKVKTVVDPTADLDSYRTYSWKPGRVLATGKPYENGVVDGQIVRSMKYELARRGFEESAEEPDFYVTYFVGAGENATADNFQHFSHREVFDYNAGVSLNEALSRPPVYNQMTGTLIIDLVDAEANKLIVRSWCSAKIKNREDRDDKIAGCARKAFDQAVKKLKD